jgi:hypothetical protein
MKGAGAMPEEMPVHPFTGQRALGVLPSGRVVWPILGGAPDDGDDADNGQDGDAGTGDGDGQGDGDATGSAQGGDGLGDKGREALAKERQARRDAEKARKAAERELADLKAKSAAGQQQDDAAKAAEQARRDAEDTANKRANERILRAEVRAAAAGKLADPADALAFIDMSQFEFCDDGSVDADEITEAISDLLKRKPHLAAKAQGFQGGDGDGPGRNGATRPKQLTSADIKNMSAADIVKARQEGRLERYLSGS